MNSLILVASATHLTTPTSLDEFAMDSRFYRLDPRAKIISAIVFAVAVSLMSQLLPLAIAFVSSVAILAVSGLRLRAISRQMRIIAMLIAFIALPVFFFRGLEAFAAMFLRIVSATLVMIVMVLTTASADLSNGLRRLGLPKALVSMLAMTYRYLFVYGDEARRMTRARESRGIGHGRSLLNRHVLQTISSTAGLILVKAYGRARRTHRAMKARGYTGEGFGGKRLKMAGVDSGLVVMVTFLSVFLLLMNWGFVQWMRL